MHIHSIFSIFFHFKASWVEKVEVDNRKGADQIGKTMIFTEAKSMDEKNWSNPALNPATLGGVV